jgi:hypothetical protein
MTDEDKTLKPPQAAALAPKRGVKRKAYPLLKPTEVFTVDYSKKQSGPPSKSIRFVCPTLGLAIVWSSEGWLAHCLTTHRSFTAAAKAINRNKKKVTDPKMIDFATRKLELTELNYVPSTNRINVDKTAINEATGVFVEYIDCDTGIVVKLIIETPMFKDRAPVAKVDIFNFSMLPLLLP